MASAKIIITFDSEKLAAIKQFINKDVLSIEDALREQLEKLYTKTVPAPVRQYIDGKAKPASVPKPKNSPKYDVPPNTTA